MTFPIRRPLRNRRWRCNHEATGEDQKFRVQPFLKGWRASKEQSSLAGTHFLYFRSFSQLIRLKRSARSTQKMLQNGFTGRCPIFRPSGNPRRHRERHPALVIPVVQPGAFLGVGEEATLGHHHRRGGLMQNPDIRRRRF